MRQHHDLKIHPKHARARREGKKRCEIRKNDRNFKVGDILHLYEYAPGFGYLPNGGEEKPLVAFEDSEITWMTNFGMKPGYVCLDTGDA